MKSASRMAALVVAIMVSFSSISAYAALAMPTWTSDSGRFSVKMPGKPAYTSKEVRTESGTTVTSHNFNYETADGKTAYLVVYSDNPAGWNLNGVVAGWAKAGQMSNRESFTFKGRDGRKAIVDSEGYTTYMYAVLDGKRIYQLAFGNPKNAPVPSEANEFIQSFRIED